MDGDHPSRNDGEQWMSLEGGADSPPSNGSHTSRFAGIGASVPERRQTSAELMASTKHKTHIELERLTGIRERHIVGRARTPTRSRSARRGMPWRTRTVLRRTSTC